MPPKKAKREDLPNEVNVTDVKDIQPFDDRLIEKNLDDTQIKDTFEQAETLLSEQNEVRQQIKKEELINLITKDDEFLKSFQKNLKRLNELKFNKYRRIFNSTMDLYDETGKIVFSVRREIQDILTLAFTKISKPIEVTALKPILIDAIENRKDGIQSLTGKTRDNIRQFLLDQIYILGQNESAFFDNFLNISITGSPGIGKTKLANVIAYVYGNIGILLKPFPENIIVGSAKNFIGSFEGQTINKTNRFLLSNLECVVFVDEAYNIMACSPDETLSKQQSYGPEAISEIVNFLDVYRGLSVIIIAGYEKAINNCFFGANKGMKRRFPQLFQLLPYSYRDLIVQFVNLANEKLNNDVFKNKEILDALVYLIKTYDKEKLFTNQGGDIANLVSVFLKQIFSLPHIKWTFERPNAKQIIGNILLLKLAFDSWKKSKSENDNLTPPAGVFAVPLSSSSGSAIRKSARASHSSLSLPHGFPL
jgi:hypothetical protein